MKNKLLTLLITLALMASVAACGAVEETEELQDPDEVIVQEEESTEGRNRRIRSLLTKPSKRKARSLSRQQPPPSHPVPKRIRQPSRHSPARHPRPLPKRPPPSSRPQPPCPLPLQHLLLLLTLVKVPAVWPQRLASLTVSPMLPAV